VLPYPDHRPPQFGQTPIGVAVAFKVGRDLCPPPLGVVLRPSPVDWATVPEAAVNEHGNSLSGEYDVDGAFRAFDQPCVDPVTETFTEEARPQRLLEWVVLTFGGLHSAPCRRRRREVVRVFGHDVASPA